MNVLNSVFTGGAGVAFEGDTRTYVRVHTYHQIATHTRKRPSSPLDPIGDNQPFR
jgi:hypothetical protein